MRRILFVAALILSFKSHAQINADSVIQNKTSTELEWLKRIKVSGYIQAQFQLADSAGQRSFNGGNFQPGVDQRFMVRRGRIKFQHDAKFNRKDISTSQYVLQFDVTEKGLTIKDAYIKLTDPWSGWVSLTAGMQNRPFGYEIFFSSSLRESPERGRMSQILFPNERDLGAMVTVQGHKRSGFHWLKLDAGFFNGTGGPSAMQDASDFDRFKDFISHLSANHSSVNKKITVGGGISYYYGGYRIDSVNVYRSAASGFAIDVPAESNHKNGILANRNRAIRSYAGADLQFSFDWIGGLTSFRAEYISGEQPGNASGSTSPVTAVVSDIYKRDFNGAYIYLVQNIAKSPLQAIIKYDWYDPNTEIECNELGAQTPTDGRPSGSGDVKYDTWGFGLAYNWDSSLKITAYYDLVKNETSANLSGFTRDIPDNIFTLRAQYKF